MEHEFSHEVIHEAYERSNHRCQCTDPECQHTSGEGDRCTHFLRWLAWNDIRADDCWRVMHVDAEGPGTIGNAMVLCAECAEHAIELAQRAEIEAWRAARTVPDRRYAWPRELVAV